MMNDTGYIIKIDVSIDGLIYGAGYTMGEALNHARRNSESPRCLDTVHVRAASLNLVRMVRTVGLDLPHYWDESRNRFEYGTLK